MFSLVLKSSLVFLMVMSVALTAIASQGGGEAEGDEKKEEAAKVEVKAEESYDKVAARVSALEAKVKSGQEEIEKLIEAKSHTQDPAAINDIVKQMLALHKDLKKNVEEYNQARGLMKYRYPEKGLTTKREYERLEVKSLDDMESQMSLSSSVNRTLKKVRTQYVAPEGANQHTASDQMKTGSGSKNAPKAPELTEPVILKK